MSHANWKPYPKIKPKDKDYVDVLVTLLIDGQLFVASAEWRPNWQLFSPFRDELIVAWDYSPEPFRPEAKDE